MNTPIINDFISDEPKIFSVSEINRLVKKVLIDSFDSVWIKGEISNFKHHSSGHMYFTLKDQGAELRCVMFRGFNQGIHFKPEDGMDVILQGKSRFMNLVDNTNLWFKIWNLQGLELFSLLLKH